MATTVEYCLSSCDAGLRSLTCEGDVRTRERRCLEHCGICKDRPFAVADGDLITEPELSSLMDSLPTTSTEEME